MFYSDNLCLEAGESAVSVCCVSTNPWQDCALVSCKILNQLHRLCCIEFFPKCNYPVKSLIYYVRDAWSYMKFDADLYYCTSESWEFVKKNILTFSAVQNDSLFNACTLWVYKFHESECKLWLEWFKTTNPSRLPDIMSSDWELEFVSCWLY